MSTGTQPVRSQIDIPRITIPEWPRHLLTLGLILSWLAVIFGLPAQLPPQAASWLAFTGLMVVPGYLLADIAGWRLKLDWLEQLALAFPLSIAVLALPGTVVLLRHLTIDELYQGWIIAVNVVLTAWLIHSAWIRFPALFEHPAGRPAHTPWRVDEVVLAVLLACLFIAMLPLLNLAKIDGDAYAVNAFAADALAGLPLNATEPLFGTDLGPGARMIFNQALTMSYLWSHLAGLEANTLIATASRPMLALWAMLAAYTLGKAAGAGSRRLGLFVVVIQMLIYLSAPFFRGDNVSLFFFERINADKFMVPAIILPLVFALAIRFVHRGRRDLWLIAAIAAFAVSTIHPLIAAMLALALGAFGAIHLLAGFRIRIRWRGHWLHWLRDLLSWKSASLDKACLWRVVALWALIPIVMLLPLMQLVIARGEAPLAPSYPSSFEGWPLGERLVPALPFIPVRTLDLYGPLPALDQVSAEAVHDSANPFLIWRFGVNMMRRRLILFSLNQYISDPNILFEPPYLLALLLLPLHLLHMRRSLASQFVAGVTLAILFVMFNPLITPLLGSLVMPWILWRFIWLMPYALAIALPLYRLLDGLSLRAARWLNLDRAGGTEWGQALSGGAIFGCVILLGVLLWPATARNMRALYNREASPFFYPTPMQLFTYLEEATATDGPTTVLADQEVSVTLPAYVARAAVVAHRVPTTSEVFPADRQDEALQRLIDQATFFRAPYLTEQSLETLARYRPGYIIAPGGSDLEGQLQLAPHWFERLLTDQSYVLYRVLKVPDLTASIRGNTALAQHHWDEAEQFYLAALAENETDLLALAGLSEVAQARGGFNEALEYLRRARLQQAAPALHYRLGRLYAKQGQTEQAAAEFELAQRAAPGIFRFHAALGDACLTLGREACAAAQYRLAVDSRPLPDETARLIAQADLWRLQGRHDYALPLYERAVALRPSEFNRFVLESAYREAGRFAQAQAVVRDLKMEQPLSAEIAALRANLLAAEDRLDESAAAYRQAIRLRDLQGRETAGTRIALTQMLLNAGRLDDAGAEIVTILERQPFNAFAYRLQGDLYSRQGDLPAAVDAYQRAFQLDPTQIAVYIALSSQLRQTNSRSEGILAVLETAIRLNPDEAILFLALGDQLSAMGNLPAAVDAYQLALDRFEAYSLVSQPRPRSNELSRAFTYARLGRAHDALGRLDPALNYYQAAVATAPNLPWPHVMLGDALRARNDQSAAKAAYDRALQIDPDYAPAYVGLADLSVAQTDYDQAELLLQRAMSSDDQSQSTYLRLGDVAGQQGDTGRALAWYRQAASLDPDDGPANIALIDSLVRFGGYDSALAYIEAALPRQPEDGELHLQLGRVQRLLGHYNDAEQALVEARQSGVTDRRLYEELSALYRGQGRPAAALEVYQEAIDYYPDEANYYLALAQLMVSQGDVDGSLEILTQGLDQTSQPAALYAAIADLHTRRNRPELAQTILEQGLAILGQDEQLLAALAGYYATRAEFETAEQRLNEVLAAQPDSAALHIALADLLLSLERAEEALEHYQAAAALEPANAGYQVNLGDLNQSLARPDEAIAAYRRAINADPTLLDPYLNLADLYRAQSRPDEAGAVYRQGLAALPNAGLLRVHYGAFLLDQGQVEAGQQALSEAVAVEPAAATLLARAALYRSLGRLDEAEADLNRARLQAPADVDLLAALGDLYRERGNFDAARQQYETVVALAPGLPLGYLRLGALAGQQGDLVTAQQYVDAARAAQPGALLP